MTDQIRISDSGGLEIERTWDGQPLWSTETEQERLFAGDAFQQMPGQLPIEDDPHRLRDCTGLIPVDPDARSWSGSSS